MICSDLTQLIGHTPMVEIKGLEGQKARIAVKIEAFNPGGSVKDRIALAMIDDAIEKGLLKEGAIRKAEELHDSIPGAFIPGQFTNPANPAAHEKSTALDIWKDTEDKIDIFVAGAGATFHATVQLSRMEENAGELIVALLPDTGERYLSTGIF